MSFPSDLKAILPQWVREGLLAPSQAEAIWTLECRVAAVCSCQPSTSSAPA